MRIWLSTTHARLIHRAVFDRGHHRLSRSASDGIVDALNYDQWRPDPWNESTSLAFLSAADAGIFVAAAAGNTGGSVPNQIPGTVITWNLG